MTIKVYQYPRCSTCRKALKFLDGRDVAYDAIDTELKQMLTYFHGQIKRLFNTSGELYRALGLKDKLPTMGDDEAIALLSQHGKLIKRPFLLTGQGGTVGFKEEIWDGLV
jgi:Spx/MgsR family transcriptional regulator